MMKNLHFRDNIENFLYDKDNTITIYDNYLHIFNYLRLEKINNTELIVILNDKKIIINGDKFTLNKMTKNELLIKGIIKKAEFFYE